MLTKDELTENPLHVIDESKDIHSEINSEDIIEDLAFNYEQETQLFLDFRSHYIQKRRMNPKRLAEYLQDNFEYDVSKLNRIKDDMNSLVLLLFDNCYIRDQNNIKKELLHKAIAASYEFKNRQDRMSIIDTDKTISEIKQDIPSALSIISSDIAPTSMHIYHNENLSRITILVHQIKKRTVEPRIYNGENTEHISYEDTYPVRQTAIRISNKSYGTQVKIYHAVNSWKDTLKHLFQTVFESDYTEEMKDTTSQVTKNVIDEIKERTDENSITATQISNILHSNLASKAQTIENTKTDIELDTVREMVENIQVTGITIKSDDTTLEVIDEESIVQLSKDYEGINESISKAIEKAEKDDIEIYMTLSIGKKNTEFILKYDDWRIKNGDGQLGTKIINELLSNKSSAQ